MGTTLGPKHILYSYMEPSGSSPPGESIFHVVLIYDGERIMFIGKGAGRFVSRGRASRHAG